MISLQSLSVSSSRSLSWSALGTGLALGLGLPLVWIWVWSGSGSWSFFLVGGGSPLGSTQPRILIGVHAVFIFGFLFELLHLV